MAPLFLFLIVLVAVAGCGSSSSGSGTTTTAAASQRSKIADCMRKQGVTLPQRPAGATGPGGPGAGGGGGGGFLFGGGGGAGGGQGRQQNPKFQAAAKKCGLQPGGGGAGAGAGAGGGGAARLQNNPQLQQSIQAFVSCVRKDGYNMPSPNLSGNGPVFDPAKVNRSDPKFVSASQKCQSLLTPPQQ